MAKYGGGRRNLAAKRGISGAKIGWRKIAAAWRRQKAAIIRRQPGGVSEKRKAISGRQQWHGETAEMTSAYQRKIMALKMK